MDVPKRLLAIEGALASSGAGATLTLMSEGGERQTFFASSDVFSSVLAFMLDLDARARKGRTDPLQTAEELEIFLDMRAGHALLRVRTPRGRIVQLELSEELLVRLEDNLPKILAQLRRHKRNRPH